MSLQAHPGLAPSGPFFTSAAQRIALARERFFDAGDRPSGLVPEAVLQSWSRCLRARRDPDRSVAFEPVTPARVQTVLRRNRHLLAAATRELAHLAHALQGTSGTALLTDAAGVVIGNSRAAPRAHEQVMPAASRIGVDLSEEVIGTSAPGITLRTGAPCAVTGGEHFFGNVGAMHCVAAPIRDRRGSVAGVLDISSEHLPFAFDASALVALYATAIENRLLCAESADRLVLHLQLAPTLLDTPLAGMLCLDDGGRLDWANAAAARLLGLPPAWAAGSGPWAEDVLGLTLASCARWADLGEPRAWRLPTGLAIWLQVRRASRSDTPHGRPADADDTPPPAARPEMPTVPASAPDAPALRPPGTLRDADRACVRRAIEACGGNVAAAARRLGVSRGLIYRRLRESRTDDAAG
ncbi:helix-turn-helix domain-containing protein [Piscinibacter sakaiensis]|uniref:Uncharacterized protein n=1 Tax=Piscinibacter sakaiensis TaxID=1547922 RepID=A0A0K8NTC0_PISS1|nr:helix-turn-helix domain-containing protein [Piscinibacter sakaiensis]GAP33642.1 hypothetical protein ISF6_0088 [Piscinibacter sakaiensis]